MSTQHLYLLVAQSFGFSFTCLVTRFGGDLGNDWSKDTWPAPFFRLQLFEAALWFSSKEFSLSDPFLGAALDFVCNQKKIFAEVHDLFFDINEANK